MKNLIYFVASLLAAIAVAFFLHKWLASYNDPGYVLIGFGHWSLETSLTVFTVIQVIGFFFLYSFFRLMGVLIRMPSQVAKRRQSVKFNRSQEALIAGLFDAADGNWESAERVLIKHASNSGAPLLHYLTAARAAQSRGALDKRDEYLRKASEQSADNDMTVGLTQAELHLSEHQFDQALQTLSKLHEINPNHGRVLKMMHQAYQHLGDIEAINKLLPSLQEHKIVMEGEVKLLETQTYSRLLKQAAANNDTQTIVACWDDIPRHIRTLPGVANIYFAAMINAGASADVEAGLIKQLGRYWDATTLALYAMVESNNTAKQLQSAEQWLAVYPTDAMLFSVLGRLALKLEQMEKAEQYLLKSLHLEESVDAHQLLGELEQAKGEHDKACASFKRALALASNEVIKQAENISA
jgi:HemY protein